MSYHFSKTIDLPMEAAVSATTDALKKHGFGVLTEIDVQQTLKGTSNNDDFVIGSPAAVACRSFSLLIFRGSDCVYATSVRFYARRAHDTIMRRPFAPA